jgi:UDP-N-acetylglucosamine:LPS N-acetylglucosamine transferase
MKNMDVMIKPHTRTGGEKHLFEGNNLPDASAVLTAELCEWADVALVVGSSVITEALMQKKPALYLKYLHSNTTLFEELEACWTIHDETELKKALMSLQKNKADVPYEQTRVSDYVKQVVYGDRAQKDVLGNYEKFIVAHAGKSR